jgi:ATP-binding cassette subfamily F protein uup
LTVLIRNPNFLILDEPTNDLDLFALNRLEEFLLSFRGCLVIVSHDRYFLDKLTDHLLICREGEPIQDYYGSYTGLRLMQEQGESGKEQGGRKNGGSGSRPEAAPGVTAEKTKLTYREQREFERLEPEIEELEKEKARLEEEIGGGKLEYMDLEQHSRRVAEIMELVETKLQRWTELGQYVK